MVECKSQLSRLTGSLHGGCHDVDYAISEVERMGGITALESLNDHIVRAIECASAAPCGCGRAHAARSHQQKLMVDALARGAALEAAAAEAHDPPGAPVEAEGDGGGEEGGGGAAAGEGGEGGAAAPPRAKKKRKKKRKEPEIVAKTF